MQAGQSFHSRPSPPLSDLWTAGGELCLIEPDCATLDLSALPSFDPHFCRQGPEGSLSASMPHRLHLALCACLAKLCRMRPDRRLIGSCGSETSARELLLQTPRASVVQQQQDNTAPGKDVDIRVQATKRIKSLGEAGRAREAVSELAQMAR